IALLRRQIPGGIDDREARLAQPFLQPVSTHHETAFLTHAPCSSVDGHRTETETETPVLPALLLDLADVDLSHLAGGTHVRTTAGLAVNAAALADADEPYPARAGRRAHILGFHQAGIGGKVLIGDPAGED